jgi:hypothetical protein
LFTAPPAIPGGSSRRVPDVNFFSRIFGHGDSTDFKDLVPIAIGRFLSKGLDSGFFSRQLSGLILDFKLKVFSKDLVLLVFF